MTIADIRQVGALRAGDHATHCPVMPGDSDEGPAYSGKTPRVRWPKIGKRLF
jgi:hypothetical protein